MKNTWMNIMSLLACAFLVAACGYGGEGALDGGQDGQDGSGGDQRHNECEQAAEVFMQGFDQACAPRSTTCCFCKCWFDGRKTFDGEAYSNDQTCLCEAPQPNPQPCEGEDLTQALACLADETACRQQAMDLVTDEQFGQCTLTPL